MTPPGERRAPLPTTATVPGAEPGNSGAYRLTITLARWARIRAGGLGERVLPPGTYLYLGSARRNLAQRVARHRRLAAEKGGRLHWHLDYLLAHRHARLKRAELIPGGDECALAREAAARPGVTVPVPGFGASDCRHGCPAHLYRLPARRRGA